MKRILALLLALMLLLALLAACGNQEGATSGGETPSGSDIQQPAENEAQDIHYGEEEEELATIEFWYFDLRMTGADYGEHVMDAINAITEEKINTHVNITWVTVADFQNKFTLAMSGGDPIDLTQIFTFAKLNTLYSNNQLTDITEYMQEYAPETLELMSDYIGTYTYGGKIYGVPTMRNICTNGYIIMRKDILDELNLTEKAQNLSSWSEYEEILRAVKDAKGGSGFYPVCKGAGKQIISAAGTLSHGDKFADYEVYDVLGDSLGVVYSDSEGNVSLYQAQPAYLEEIQRVRGWMEEGLVYPDSSMIDTHGDELLKQNVAFSSIQASEIGIEVTKGNSCGYELICPMVYGGMIKTSNLTSWGIGVPITSAEPAAAVKFLNLMYTDPEIMNLLTWGVEGTDYEIQDGQVVQPENGYYYEADFLIGNNTLLTPLYGNGADFYERVKKVVAEAPLSPYLGFVLDTGDMDLVISQISAVVDQYFGPMNCGVFTDDEYQEYLKKLESAGVNDYLGEIQTQLNAWLAQQ